MFVSAVFAILTFAVSQVSARPQAAPEIAVLDSAKLGDVARTRELLSRGAAINTADRRGFTLRKLDRLDPSYRN